MALEIGIGYGYVSNRVTTPKGKHWASQEEAVAEFKALFNNAPYWEEYEAAGKCTVAYELASSRSLDLQINFTSKEACDEYLQDQRLYTIKPVLLDNTYRLDWSILNSAGEVHGGSVQVDGDLN